LHGRFGNGLRVEKKKFKTKGFEAQAATCRSGMSFLQSVTWGRAALGYKEAVVPGRANPRPPPSSVDFREVSERAQEFPCQEHPIRLEP